MADTVSVFNWNRPLTVRCIVDFGTVKTVRKDMTKPREIIMNKIINGIILHPKISIWIIFLITIMFYGEDNFMGKVVQIPATLFFIYFLYIVIKWLFGLQGIGVDNKDLDNKGGDNELWASSTPQGKVGKMRRGMRRARKMKR